MAYQTWTIATQMHVVSDDGDSECVSYDVDHESYPHLLPFTAKDFSNYGTCCELESDKDGRLIMALFSREDMEYDRDKEESFPVEIVTRIELDELIDDEGVNRRV